MDYILWAIVGVFITSYIESYNANKYGTPIPETYKRQCYGTSEAELLKCSKEVYEEEPIQRDLAAVAELKQQWIIEGLSCVGHKQGPVKFYFIFNERPATDDIATFKQSWVLALISFESGVWNEQSYASRLLVNRGEGMRCLGLRYKQPYIMLFSREPNCKSIGKYLLNDSSEINYTNYDLIRLAGMFIKKTNTNWGFHLKENVSLAEFKEAVLGSISTKDEPGENNTHVVTVIFDPAAYCELTHFWGTKGEGFYY